jgi:hypothetical protein
MFYRMHAARVPSLASLINYIRSEYNTGHHQPEVVHVEVQLADDRCLIAPGHGVPQCCSQVGDLGEVALSVAGDALHASLSILGQNRVAGAAVGVLLNLNPKPKP